MNLNQFCKPQMSDVPHPRQSGRHARRDAEPVVLNV